MVPVIGKGSIVQQAATIGTNVSSVATAYVGYTGYNVFYGLDRDDRLLRAHRRKSRIGNEEQLHINPGLYRRCTAACFAVRLCYFVLPLAGRARNDELTGPSE